MIPPALATKSGAHRMPRSASRSAIASSASWLLAAPATIGTWRVGTDSWSRMPPRAHGARTSAFVVSALAGVTQRAPSCSATCFFDRSMSATTSFAPALASSFASARADVAEPVDDDRAALRVGGAELALQRRADRGVDAERRPGARVARAAALARQAGDVLRLLRDLSMSLADVPTSSAVTYLPRSRRPSRRSRAAPPCAGARRARRRGSTITPLPPPSGRPATADL